MITSVLPLFMVHSVYTYLDKHISSFNAINEELDGLPQQTVN